VLATAFNIKAFKGQENIKVTVTRGRVRVETGRQVLGTLTSNEQMAVNTATNAFHLFRVDADAETQWKKQFLILEDISLADAAILINDRYHIHILFANEAIRRCRISATFSNDETLEQVLTVICGVTSSEYTLQPNDQVVINGNGCD
jgi:ferric-dicitrate binding protein FerR (iron transport regulator)